MHQKKYQEKYIGGKIWRQTQESTLEIFIPGGYIKTAKTKKRPFFGQDRNFFVSKSQDLSRFPEKFPVFCVVTHTPGLNQFCLSLFRFFIVGNLALGKCTFNQVIKNGGRKVANHCFQMRLRNATRFISS